jgi:hypothetical protein
LETEISRFSSMHGFSTERPLRPMTGSQQRMMHDPVPDEGRSEDLGGRTGLSVPPVPWNGTRHDPLTGPAPSEQASPTLRLVPN